MFTLSSSRLPAGLLTLVALLLLPVAAVAADDERDESLMERLRRSRGLCVVLGEPDFALDLARLTEMTIFVQSPNAEEVEKLRKEADEAGLLGKRLWVQKGDLSRLHLANDLADALVVG